MKRGNGFMKRGNVFSAIEDYTS